MNHKDEITEIQVMDEIKIIFEWKQRWLILNDESYYSVT